MSEREHRSGFVALVGRPNAGKSTLLNRILETKLVAVTPRPQTTRNRILGIYDREGVQIVFQDTPGLLEPKDNLHEFMVSEAERALADADVVVWLIDSIKGLSAREKRIAEQQLTRLTVPLIVAFNKCDKIKVEERAERMAGIHRISFSNEPLVTFISALHGNGVDALLETIQGHLKEGPSFFDPNQLSDRPQRFFVEEIIREKAFLRVREEIPYSLAVHVEEMKEREDGLVSIQAVLHVERDSQKGILLGKQGSMIKKIGMEARQEIEKLLHCRVYLDLWIKVSPLWRKKPEKMREFGYVDREI